jgi:hypothetical protein
MMRRPLVFFLLLIAGWTSPALAQGPSHWKPFTSEKGCFTILFPGTPLETTKPVVTGDRYLYWQHFEVVGAGWFVNVRYTDLSADVKKAEVEEVLEETTAEALDAVGGKLLAKKKILLDGKHPGRDFLLQLNTVVFLHSRCSLVGQRLYTVDIQGLRDQVTSPEADRFLDSFRLTRLPPVVKAPPPPPPPALKPYSSSDGAFTVLLPGTPKVETAEVMMVFGPLVHQLVNAQTGKLSLMIDYCDYPVTPPDPQHTMAKVAKRLVENLKGTIVREKVLPGEIPAREYLIRMPDSQQVKARSYVVKDRLYQLFAGGPIPDLNSPTTERFFDSFRLAK